MKTFRDGVVALSRYEAGTGWVPTVAAFAAFGAILDQKGIAAGVLSADARVLYANRAAHELFAACDEILVSDAQRLSIARPDVGAVFARALDAAEASQQRLLSVVADGRSSNPSWVIECGALVLTVTALGSDISGGRDAVAVLSVSRRQADQEDGAASLRQRFGLSAGEARLVLQLAEGLLLKEIALRRQISYETVRSQLRRVMHKTGSRRQADLIRLVGEVQCSCHKSAFTTTSRAGNGPVASNWRMDRSPLPAHS